MPQQNTASPPLETENGSEEEKQPRPKNLESVADYMSGRFGGLNVQRGLINHLPAQQNMSHLISP